MAGSGTAQLRSGEDIVLAVTNLVVEYPMPGRGTLKAVSDVSFDIRRGETLGIVGESGCGKSTAARAVLQLPSPRSGSIRFEDKELTKLSHGQLRRLRPSIQVIFQDPISSLNPRRRIRDIVAEPLRIWRNRRKAHASQSTPVGLEQIVDQLLAAVGMDPELTGARRPHELSGGQCQRVSIARALALDPAIVVCDEPVSALDVSVQAQILNLLEDMKDRYGLTLLFISHDLSVVRHMSDRVMVMYLGKVCEIGDADSILSRPAHPYTRALMAAIPDGPAVVDDSEADISSELPSPIDPPSGCRFHPRCPRALDVCRVEEPTITRMGDDHFLACHNPVLREGASGQVDADLATL
jgi:peptide/nickel transport system ATP-binding protein